MSRALHYHAPGWHQVWNLLALRSSAVGALLLLAALAALVFFG